MFHFPSFSRPPNFSLSLALSLSFSLQLSQRTMRHNKHSTETTESRFLGTISAFSIRNHHDAMEERTAEENKVVEKAERMGSVAMESSAHLTDLTCLALISPTQRRSRLPRANLSSPFHFFFLSSSTPHRSRLSFSFVAVG